ncbi:hypothetical protein CRUP_012875 [Coryphaenoides rupestris]|nr:hypothetical protein CRUP_012875 [Coryphaenoides rupestris]
MTGETLELDRRSQKAPPQPTPTPRKRHPGMREAEAPPNAFPAGRARGGSLGGPGKRSRGAAPAVTPECGSGMASARQTLTLWQGTMKEIGGRFGTSVLSYFLFLKSLLLLNVFSFLVNFGFITIPMLAYNHLPQVPQNVTFRGLELLSGAGYFNYTVMYYGGYSPETIMTLVGYNMQLSMASSFKRNYVLSDPVAGGSWQLLCSWDFSMTNEKAVRQRKNNLRVQLKKLKQFGIHLGAWFVSTSLAVGCGGGIYFLSQYEQRQITDTEDWSLLQEAETLLVPFVVSLVNLVVPLFYSLFNKFEVYSNQRRQIYVLIFRNVILKMSILGILCYYWMHEVAKKFSCWESMVGQALYRLVIFDFFFLMLGSFFGEFLSNLTPSKHCGPFQGLNNTISVVGLWMTDLEGISTSDWVKIKRRLEGSSSAGGRSNSNAMVQTFLAVGQENRGSYSHDVPVPSDISTTSFQRIPIANNRQSSSSYSHSDGVTLAIQARQRAELDDTDRTPSTFAANPLVQVMQARQGYDRQAADEADDRSSSMSSIMMQVMEARKRAAEEEEEEEEEDEDEEWVYGRLAVTESSAAPSSSALIQAMLARQQAQNEYDDGY